MGITNLRSRASYKAADRAVLPRPAPCACRCESPGVRKSRRRLDSARSPSAPRHRSARSPPPAAAPPRPRPRASGARKSISSRPAWAPIKPSGTLSSSATTSLSTPESACGTNSRIARISCSDKKACVARTERSHTSTSAAGSAPSRSSHSMICILRPPCFSNAPIIASAPPACKQKRPGSA